jgi:hypothetical protein
VLNLSLCPAEDRNGARGEIGHRKKPVMAMADVGFFVSEHDLQLVCFELRSMPVEMTMRPGRPGRLTASGTGDGTISTGSPGRLA